jgi:hypothetical protein
MMKGAQRIRQARILRPVGFLTLISVVLPASAYAYVDPSTGSILIQVLVAGALGAAFTISSGGAEWQRR